MASDRQDRPDFSADHGPSDPSNINRDSHRLFSGQINGDCPYLLLGDFRVGPPVGEGGFATVHVGWQASTGRKVAVKILHDGQPAEQVARFQKEAAYLARFNHPNIVSVLGFGHATWAAPPAGLDERGQPDEPEWLAHFRQSAPVKTFIALEWIDGRTLEQVYRASHDDPAARPTVRTLAEWFAQSAGGLAAVHATGLIHRDVKPSNLMVTADGTIKLMDFGIALSQDENRTLMTATGHVCGTLAYMSPEQVRAADSEALIGPASDIYSLCATFYELFTRTRLLKHDTQGPATIHTLKLSGAAPQRPRALVAGLPWEIETILMGGLEPEVPDRFRSMDGLEADLRRFLADEPIHYSKPSLRRRMALGYRRHRTAVNLAAIFLLAAAVGIGLYIGSIRSEQARTLTQKQLADEQRDLAQRSERESQARLASAFEEQGRQELLVQVLADRPTRAVVFLSEAYARGRIGPATRYLLAQAMRAVPATAPTYRGHTRGVYTAEYSPDNSRIVTAGRDGRVKIWNGANGALLRTFEMSPTHEVNGAMFNSDGTCVVAANDGGQAAVWDVNTGRLLFEMNGHVGNVYTPRFSPDGLSILTAGEDGTARVWNAIDGRLIPPALPHKGPLVCAFFSPDGKKIVTGCEDGRAFIWDAKTHQPLHTLASAARITRAIFSPDGKYVLTTSADPLASTQVFDAETGTRLTRFSGHTDIVRRGLFSPDSTKIITSSKDATARLWTWFRDDDILERRGKLVAGTFKEDSVVLKHEGQVFAATFSSDGRVVGTASRDATVKLWDATTGGFLRQLTGHTGYIYQLVFTNDNARILTASEDHTARIWEASSGRLLATLDGRTAGPARSDSLKAKVAQSGYAKMVSFSPDGRRFVVTSDVPGVWETATGKHVATLASLTGRPRAAVFSPDGGRIATVDDDHTVAVWDVKAGEVRTLPMRGEGAPDLRWVAFSPTGRRLLVAATRAVWILDADSLEVIKTLRDPAAGHDVLHAEFSPDGTGSRFVTAGSDSAAKVWDANSGDLICTLPHRGEVAWATFSPDGKLVLTASRDATAAVWDASTGKQLHSLAGHSDYVRRAVFSADGRRIVTASRDYTAKVWDSNTGLLVSTLDGHRGLLTCAAFSPEGSLVVTASEDGQAIVWDAETGKLLAALRGHLSDVCWAGFSPGGGSIVTASEDHTVRIWDATLETRSPAEIARIIRERVPWRLEGERLVPAEPEPLPTSRPATTQRDPD